MEAAARKLIGEATFHWHQRFPLAPGVFTPGTNDLPRLFEVARVPDDLSGVTVLDIGTSNGGVSFEAERRGAARVVATDITPMEHCGFDRLRAFLGSRVEFVQAGIYDLPDRLDGERFDLVFFWGVLYHLRHPLHALDCLRRLAGGTTLVETAVCDAELARRAARLPLVRFYRGAGLEGDASNWFVPTIRALLDWCSSSGFDATLLGAWPPPLGRVRALTVLDRLEALARRRPYTPVPRLAGPSDRSAMRALVRLEPTSGEPEFKQVSWAEQL